MSAGAGLVETGFSDDGSGLWLPQPSDVFNLPEGCTCHSTDADIIDNGIGPDCPDVVSVDADWWTRVKSRFR